MDCDKVESNSSDSLKLHFSAQSSINSEQLHNTWQLWKFNRLKEVISYIREYIIKMLKQTCKMTRTLCKTVDICWLIVSTSRPESNQENLISRYDNYCWPSCQHSDNKSDNVFVCKILKIFMVRLTTHTCTLLIECSGLCLVSVIFIQHNWSYLLWLPARTLESTE